MREGLLPGEAQLKKVLITARKKLPQKSMLINDANAGFTVAMNEIPDGMACGLLAGVSPVMGLFAALCGCFIGGIMNSSKLMIISTTSASAFLLFQLTQDYPVEQRIDVLILLVLLSGVMMILMGFLKMGKMMRFVSYSVMNGFLAGISLLTILSQLPTLFAIQVEGSNKLTQTISLFLNIHLVEWRALSSGVLTILMMWLLPKTPLKHRSAIVAVSIPSLVIYAFQWYEVEVVNDIGKITGVPSLRFPDVTLLEPSIFGGAFSLALISLIQASGVSQSVPNPDGSRSSASKDFLSQGVANVASGVWGGIGVGGSMGSTSLNIISGARSRWSGIFAGLLVLSLILFLPNLIGNVAMPVLAALMIFAMLNAIKPKENIQVWNAGWASRIGLLSAFTITLFMPIQYAVLVSVLLSFSLYFFSSSLRIRLRAIRLLEDGRFREVSMPDTIESEKIYIFTIDGDLHFAGARMLENQWPRVDSQTRNPVIILALRGRNNIGATLTEVIETFYDKIKASSGQFYITELDTSSYASFIIQVNSEVLRGMHIMKKDSIIGESTRMAIHQGRTWLKKEKLNRG